MLKKKLGHLFVLFICILGVFSVSHWIYATTYGHDTYEDLIKNAQFSQLEEGEAYPGGHTTHNKSLDRNSFSHPSQNMSFEKQLDFKVGNGIFKKIWVSSPASTKASDGLGPLFNAKSCQHCHLKDGRGHPPEANWPHDNAVSMFLRLSIPPQNNEQKQLIEMHKANVIPDPVYGGQLQDLAIQGHYAEGRMHITYKEVPVTFSDGERISLRKPTYKVTDLQYGPLHPDVMLSPRVTPQMIGLGLLEAIPAHDILTWADPQDKNNDGISGKANIVWSHTQNQETLGRFGWKAGQPDLLHQSSGAFHGDIGLSNPLHPSAYGDCTINQEACQQAPDGNSPEHDQLEVSQQMMDLLVFYTKNLAVPPRRNPDDPDILKGKKIFFEAGCAACHRPKFKTSCDEKYGEQSCQIIWPYTDMLLHDMGEGLADHRPEGEASGTEWRTAPLWGIGLTKTVNGHTYYLHDGRARNLLEAILWHGGEAEKSKNHVLGLNKTEREQLLRFIESL